MSVYWTLCVASSIPISTFLWLFICSICAVVEFAIQFFKLEVKYVHMHRFCAIFRCYLLVVDQ